MDFAEAYLLTKLGYPELAGWWGKLLSGGVGKTFYKIAPEQPGTGDPGPENLRPISPGLTITRDDGSVLEVYGGTLDVTTGVLTVDKALVTLTSSMTWKLSKMVVAGGRSIFYLYGGISDCVPATSNHNEGDITMQSSHYDIGSTSYYSLKAKDETFAMGIGLSMGHANVGFLIEDSLTGGDPAGLGTWLTNQSNAGTPVQVVYPLAAPATYYLTRAEVKRAVQALTQ